MNPLQKVIKRCFDIVGAAVGLLLLWPVIAVCSVLAAKDTNSSGLFRQERVGRNGVIFTVYKIRTMIAGAESALIAGTESTITIANDPRVTSFGSFLRKYKLDELPQLWNVLIGDMSFVGPRPDVKGYMDEVGSEYTDVLKLRPGITGPATLKYRNEEKLLASVDNAEKHNRDVIWPDKLEINMAYAQDWSLRKDISYIFSTVTSRSAKVHSECNAVSQFD